MTGWTWAALVVAATISTAAAAQDGVDWGSIMHAEAMGSATMEAAREGQPAQAAEPSGARAGEREKARANCAKVRGWIAKGERDPRLPRLVGLCKQLGL